MEKDVNKNSGWIPYIFFGFFIFVILVNIIYIIVAVKSWRGIYTDNSYQKGLNYNETIAIVKKQKNSGKKLQIKYTRQSSNQAIINVCFIDKNSILIKDAKIIVKFKRPIQEGFDFSQDFIPENGCYSSKVNFPLKGVWDLEVAAIEKDTAFQEVKRYIVQ